MTVARGLAIYTALMASLLVLGKLALALPWISGWLPFFAYFAFGLMMNRWVLRKSIAWQAIDTKMDLVSAKVRAWLLWPIFYPALFLKLGVIRH